ncbi:MAG: HPr family phosphocarrier protein [Longimicrobiales bacterium]
MSTPVLESSRTVRISNKFGMHARPAAEFVKAAHTYRCDVFVLREDLEVNGKSIMGMMMLAAEYGSEITIRATGEDAGPAVDALVALVKRGFGEV